MTRPEKIYVRAILRLLKDLKIYHQFVKNYYNDGEISKRHPANIDDYILSSFYDFPSESLITNAFDFDKTREGFEYWNIKDKTYCRNFSKIKNNLLKCVSENTKFYHILQSFLTEIFKNNKYTAFLFQRNERL